MRRASDGLRLGAMGRAPEHLSLKEQAGLAGLTVAFEIYTPARLPERRILAIGDSAEDCAQQLRAAGRDPRDFEFVALKPPY